VHEDVDMNETIDLAAHLKTVNDFPFVSLDVAISAGGVVEES